MTNVVQTHPQGALRRLLILRVVQFHDHMRSSAQVQVQFLFKLGKRTNSAWNIKKHTWAAALPWRDVPQSAFELVELYFD